MEEIYNIQKNQEELVQVLKRLDINFDEELEFCDVEEVGIDFKNIDKINYDSKSKEIEIIYFSESGNTLNWMKRTPKMLKYKKK